MTRVIISNSSLNSYGTRVLTEGVDIEQYKRNPVLLHMHHRGLVVGYVKDIKKEDDNITGELVFDEATELSIQLKKQYEVGSMRMVSAGLDIIETSGSEKLRVAGQVYETITKSKLYEVSAVDVGANDDAIVLRKQGQLLELSQGGECTQLTKLNKNMERKQLALQLGLGESATETQISEKISELQGLAKECITLRTEVDKTKKATINAMVEGAIKEGKIVLTKKETFIELGNKVGIEELKEVFEAMPKTQKLSAMAKEKNLESESYKKLSEVPEAELKAMRDTDKATYIKLFKAEYGYEPEV